MSTEPVDPSRTDEGPTDPLLERGATLEALAALLETLPNKPGALVKGRVTAVDGEAVTVRVEGGESRVALAEFGDAVPAAGDEVDVYVLAMSAGGPVLSRERAARLAVFDRLLAAAERDEPVEGRVLARTSGGLSVDVGMKALLPDRRGKATIGEQGRFWVRGWDDRKEVFLLAREARSARDARKASKQAAAAEGPVTLPEAGDVVTGTVARLAEFGAFVDLPGGATGLLHVKEMGWGRGTDPAQLVSVGDQVTVKVTKVQAEGAKGPKISLSKRALEADPWSTVDGRLQPGQRVTATVVGFADYGAFVEVEPGVEGLVHVSEMSWSPGPANARALVKQGQQVEAEILAVDAAKKHLKLSMKRLQPSPWTLLREKFPVGTQVRGKIKSVAAFGLFVTLDEENGLDGLVHVSDVSWEPIRRLGDAFAPGQEVEVLVLGLDEERGRCSLGMRQLLPEPERPSFESYAPGQTYEAKIARVKDFGAFVEIAPGVEGLLHVSEMRLAEGARPKSKFRPGQPVNVRVLNVDVEARRIGLGLADPPAAEAPPAADTATGGDEPPSES
jgi:small subunit ribosomal protein S1